LNRNARGLYSINLNKRGMEPGKRTVDYEEESKVISKEVKLSEEQQEEEDLVNEAKEM